MLHHVAQIGRVVPNGDRGRDHCCEFLQVQQAHSVHRAGKILVPIIVEAHFMPPDCLRKLWLLCEDFPRSNDLTLIGQPRNFNPCPSPSNEEIRPHVTYLLGTALATSTRNHRIIYP